MTLDRPPLTLFRERGKRLIYQRLWSYFVYLRFLMRNNTICGCPVMRTVA
jgi:hypothetical protein